jgi:hypothetical protein
VLRACYPLNLVYRFMFLDENTLSSSLNTANSFTYDEQGSENK